MDREWAQAARVVLWPLTPDVVLRQNDRRFGDWEVIATYHGEGEDEDGECASVISGLPDLVRFCLTVQEIKAWHYDAQRGQTLQSVRTDVEVEDDEEDSPQEPERSDGTYDGEHAPVHEAERPDVRFYTGGWWDQ